MKIEWHSVIRIHSLAPCEVCYESSSSLYEYFFSRAGRAAFCIQIVMYVQ